MKRFMNDKYSSTTEFSSLEEELLETVQLFLFLFFPVVASITLNMFIPLFFGFLILGIIYWFSRLMKI